MYFGWVLIVAGFAGSCLAADQPYRLPLNTLVSPSSGAIGLILKTRVESGPPLRLLLDSGAEHLVLSREAARKSRLKSGAELDLVGAGASTRAARMATASVEVDTLALHDCPIVIVDGRLAEGIDGVIPLSLFADFLIRLDVPRKVLELAPYPSERQDSDPAFVRATKQRHLLFLQSRVHKAQDGFMLLDTGSAYNMIDNVAAGALPRTQSLSVTAAGGSTDARVLPGRLAVQSAGRELVFDRAVAMDLAEISRRNGIEVSGIIGYPALADAVVTVNYRESLVSIQPRSWKVAISR
jgi:aspartyl protease